MGVSEITSRAKHAFTTKSGFLAMIRTKENGVMAQNDVNGERLSSNVDLDPTPVEARRWGFWYCFLFEFSVAFAPTSYNVGASLVSIGLPYWAIIVSAFIGSAICAFVLYFNARGGSVYHVGYPVFARMTAGIRGSYFFIFLRGIIAVLYMGTQTLYASFLTAVCLRCIFGNLWTDIPNALPVSAGITSSGVIAFVIYWLIQLPFAWIHPSKAAPVFAVKSYIAPPTLVITMIWALVTAGGPHWENFAKSTLTQPDLLAWAWLKAINSIISGMLSPLINIPDLSRYAKTKESISPLGWGLFFSKPMIIIIGVLTTAAGNQLFGAAYWNQWDLYNAILTHYWSPSTRGLVFLGSLTQVYATMVTNISSNSIPVGCDLTGLFPRYFTIRRGQILCSILAILVVPWKLVYSGASFLAFLGSYVVFITPIAAMMIVDYWFIRKGNVHVPSLYKSASVSPYYYYHGFNLRAYGTWAIAVGITISGIAGVLSPGSISQTAVNIYNTGFILSGASSAIFYYVFNLIWPVNIYPAGPHEDDPKTFEYMGPSEGYFDDDTSIVNSSVQGMPAISGEVGNSDSALSDSDVEKIG